MKARLFSTIIVVTCLASCNKSGGPPTPDILGINPQEGSASIPVSITGIHFDTVISHITVKFNGVIATVYSANDSSLGVLVPAGATTGKVTVIINGRTATSDSDFLILHGSWVRKADLPNPYSYPIQSPLGRCCGIGFAIGNYGYMGLGTDNGKDFRDLYQYDPVGNTWTQKASLGIGLEDVICMVINNKAYVGIGQSRDISDFTTQFFEYDPANDSWTRKADFPGVKRWGAFGVAIAGKGYVGLGTNSGNLYYDVWQYDPATDSWTQKADFPHVAAFPIDPTGFSLGDSVVYMISGNFVWQYNPSTDAWTEKNNIPNGYRLDASAMVIDGKGHIIGGGYEHWQYDPITDSWTQLAFFADRISGASFVVNGMGYYGTGGQYPGGWLQNDLWQFQP